MLQRSAGRMLPRVRVPCLGFSPTRRMVGYGNRLGGRSLWRLTMPVAPPALNFLLYTHAFHDGQTIGVLAVADTF
jgi:hypothetical protein